MNNEIFDLFKEELLKDEEIIWSGKPNPKILFTSADIFLIPFTFLWGGFAIFWEISVLTLKSKSGEGPPFFFPLFGLIFVIVGIYLMFGRFIYKIWKKKNTFYLVTNKRVIILTRLSHKDFQAAYINSIPCINKYIRSNGIGTIKFGTSPFYASIFANSGLDFFGSFYGKDVPTFYDLNEADKVYKIVCELRNRAS